MWGGDHLSNPESNHLRQSNEVSRITQAVGHENLSSRCNRS